MGKEAGGTTRLQEQFGYGYDAAWNLNKRTNNALIHTFNANNLNELTTITRANTYTVAGSVSTNPTSVTVKDNANSAVAATVYGDNTFARDSVTLLDGTNTFTAIAQDSLSRKDTNVVAAYLPATVTHYYDVRGNLTNDGRRVFYYDDENQLTSVTVSNAWRSEFSYDGMLRRRVRKEYTWQSSAWVKTNEVRYVYDGMLVVQERDANNLALVSYTRGNDLSATSQGAGGIGGLLARTDNGQLIAGSATAHAYYHADGNGNITALVNTNQLLAAKYAYDPYGNLLGLSGPLAEANSYRFSSKEYQANAGLYYYGFRFYEPNLQRWLNRDPLGDIGSLALVTSDLAPVVDFDNDDGEMRDDKFLDGWTQVNRNLYGGIGNDPVNRIDPVGLASSGCLTLAAEPTLLMSEEAAMAYRAVQAAKAARAAALAATAATLSSDRAEKKHTPGRDHDTKSGPKKKKEFQKKAEQKRTQEKKDLEDAWKKWKDLKPEVQKLRPELKPTKPDPSCK